MTTPTPELLDYLRSQAPALVGADATFAPAGKRGVATCALVTSAKRLFLLKQYGSATAAAQHEHDGLVMGGELGLAPQLLWAEDSQRFGPLILMTAPTTPPGADTPLDDTEAEGWLFLLLTLHHLPASALRLPSATTADLGAWWQGLQPRWLTARALPLAGPSAHLIEALDRLQTIANVHAEAKRKLWTGVTAHPTHGDATPTHLAHDGARPLLLDWEACGQGDPAIDAGLALARTTLAGQLTTEQFARLRDEYLRSMRDLNDAALGERLEAVFTLAPFAACVEALERLGSPPISEGERAQQVGRIERAVSWLARSLGVEVGDVPALVAPLRA